MQLKLNKKPKNPTIIEAFPGFGLVGTIAGEFLLEHLEMEKIGKIVSDKMPAMVAIHENKIVEPLGIFYNKKYNIVILHAISASTGLEWNIADTLIKMANDLNAKEIISLEGVGSGEGEKNANRVFYHANNEKNASKLKKLNLEPLKEGIIIGVTGAILLRAEKLPVSCIFAETQTNMPDSKAAAKLIETLDKYLDLKVDPKPLLLQAEKFEGKLKNLLQQSQKTIELSEQKKMSYVG